MKKAFFFTNSLLNKDIGTADSNAGGDVQLSIIDSLMKLFRNSLTICDSSPSGEIVSGVEVAKTRVAIKTKGYLRRFTPIVFYNCIKYLVISKPNYIGIYNLYFQQILAIVIYQSVFKCKTFVVIQDYREGTAFSPRQRFVDYVSMKLVRYFDIAIPITDDLSNIVPLPVQSKLVFSGGKTRASEKSREQALQIKDEQLKHQVVCAGYLSEYNGIDLLLNRWVTENISVPLIVYGSGPLSELVHEISCREKNIIFLGKVKHSKVIDEMNHSRFNICLRFSRGISNKYFFPSKFFIGLSSSSVLLYNHFHGLRTPFNEQFDFVLDNDLKNLKGIVEDNDVLKVRNWAYQQHQMYENLDSFDVIFETMFNLMRKQSNEV